MTDVVLSLCGKIEKSYRKGLNVHKLSFREQSVMSRNHREVLSMLRDFDGIICRYDDIEGTIIFKR